MHQGFLPRLICLQRQGQHHQVFCFFTSLLLCRLNSKYGWDGMLCYNCLLLGLWWLVENDVLLGGGLEGIRGGVGGLKWFVELVVVCL